MKSKCPSDFVFSSAPAIGAPIRVAIDDTLHDIPSRVPSRERSGVIFANAAEGKVTRAAEKNPAVCQQQIFTSSTIDELETLPHNILKAMKLAS